MEKTSLNLKIMLLLKNLDRIKDILHKRMILLIDNILNNKVQEKEVIEVVNLLSISTNLESRTLSKIDEGLKAGLLLPEEVKEAQEDLKRMYELDSLNKTIYHQIRLNLIEENGN